LRKFSLISLSFLFLLIYTPVLPYLPINVLHIIGLASWVYIFINIKVISKLIDLRKIYILYLIFTVIFICLGCIALLNRNSVLSAISYLYWMFDIIPACIVITIYMRKRNIYSIENLINALLIVGTLQGIIALIAFISPTVHTSLVNLLISYGYGDVFNELSEFRIYGLASNLTFSTPILQAVLAIIALYLSINKSLIYVLFIPLLAFSAIINARASIIILLIGLIFVVLAKSKLTLKRILGTIFIFISMFILINIGLNIIQTYSLNTYQWITAGFSEIIAFLKGDFSNGYYFSYISDRERYLLPEGINLLFGTGTRTLGFNRYNFYSDIGYVNDVWLGGIFYCTIIYVIFARILFLIKKGVNKNYSLNSFLFLFLTAVLLIGNIKGIILINNEITTIILLIFIFINKANKN
jgi:hypothetical protein